jgi:hypothetical protein
MFYHDIAFQSASTIIPAILGSETVNKKPEADTIPVNATILSGLTILVKMTFLSF